MVSIIGLQQGHPVVGGEAADGVGERDTAADLAGARGARELPDALHDLREPRRGQGMTARLETSRRVDGQAAVDGGLPVQGGPAGLAGGHQAEILQRDQLEGGEGVVDLGEVDALGTEAGHGVGGRGGGLSGPKAREARRWRTASVSVPCPMPATRTARSGRA